MNNNKKKKKIAALCKVAGDTKTDMPCLSTLPPTTFRFCFISGNVKASLFEIKVLHHFC